MRNSAKMEDSRTVRKVSNATVQSRVGRKKLGSYYTPQYLANFIAEEALSAWLRNRYGRNHDDFTSIHEMSAMERGHIIDRIREIKVLDPAVGAGAFLLAAADWLLKTRVSLGEGLEAHEIRSHIVLNSLFGVDVSDDAVNSCMHNLQAWAKEDDYESASFEMTDITNVRRGNSLTGFTNAQDCVDSRLTEELSEVDAFHWCSEFEEIMKPPQSGFDVVLGNPPYGCLLGPSEKLFIRRNYPFVVGGGRGGTWNSAAHFIVRARALLSVGGTLGFLVPNSILRVGQFSKTRSFLLDEMRLWKIIDEGSPFDDVTLEMITILCDNAEDQRGDLIEIESRRPGYEQSNKVERMVLKSSRVFPIYYDSTFAKILKRGERNLLMATRGRDIPKQHVSTTKTKEFTLPYITSGRSVQRFRIVPEYQVYVDDCYSNDEKLRGSFENELLVATKNYRYPRCVIKPAGTIHGGGIVNIIPLFEGADKRAIGLILNSNLIRHVCVRYLTNYSQLTTCLNTGIVDDIPLVRPRNPSVFAALFEVISESYRANMGQKERRSVVLLENVANALVYDLYFGNGEKLQNCLERILLTDKFHNENLEVICSELRRDDVMRSIEEIMRSAVVRDVEKSLRIK